MFENKWSKDELGFISGDRIFFHLSDLQQVSKDDVAENKFRITIAGTITEIALSGETVEEDRNGLFDWLLQVSRDHRRAQVEAHREDIELRAKGVAIHDRMVNLMESNNCGHLPPEPTA